MRIWTRHSEGRGRDVRIAHRHDGQWHELIPGMPTMTPDQPGQRRQWQTLYRCPACGRTVASVTPA